MAPGGAVEFAWVLVTDRQHPNYVGGRDYDMPAAKKARYRPGEVNRQASLWIWRKVFLLGRTEGTSTLDGRKVLVRLMMNCGELYDR